MDEVGIRFGAMSEPIKKQLRDQGVALDKRDLELAQRFADSITLLACHGMLPENDVRKARKRVLKMICAKAYKR